MNLTESDVAILTDPPDPPVPKSHGGKPDKHDPWRYVCPECNAQVNRSQQSFSYQCGGCRSTWPFEDLYDKKYDMTVAERQPPNP